MDTTMNSQNNGATPRHERIMNAKSEIHSVIDRIFDIQWKDLDTASGNRFIETGGNAFDPAFEATEQEKQNIEEQKAQLHDAVELYKLEHYKAIWDELLEHFRREKRKAEQHNDDARLNELRALFESAKRAFDEIIAVVAELHGDTSEESQEARAAFAHKAGELKQRIEQDLGEHTDANEPNENELNQRTKHEEENQPTSQPMEERMNSRPSGRESVKGEQTTEGKETSSSSTWELDTKNETIRKIKENRSAAALLVLLEYEYLPNATENVDVEKLVERVLKEYHSVDEVERDLMRVLNDRLGHEERMKHRWDGYQVLLDALRPLFEAKAESAGQSMNPESSRDGGNALGEQAPAGSQEEGEQNGENASSNNQESGDEPTNPSAQPPQQENAADRERGEEGNPEGNVPALREQGGENRNGEGQEGQEGREIPRGNIMTALERARESATNRKINYIKKVMTQFADKDRLMTKTSKGSYAKRILRWINAKDNDQELHQKYLRALELAQRPTNELTDEERKFFLSLDLRQFVNEKRLKNDGLLDSYSLTKESIRRLEDHLMNLEAKITRDEVKDRNFLVKGFNEFRVLWRKFKVWHQNPENKRELRKRIRFSALSAIGTTLTGGFLAPALFGQIAAASFGSQAIRFAGSYLGGETFRKVYDATEGRDFREKFVKLRKWRAEQLKEARETIKDPELLKKRVEQITQSYNGRRDELLKDEIARAKKVRKQQNRRIWADRIGRVVGAFAAAGLEHYIQTHNAHEHVEPITAEEMKPKPLPEHGPVTDLPDHIREWTGPFLKDGHIKPELLTKDIFIKPGDGVTQIMQRQLSGNPDLMKVFGIQDTSPLTLKHLAEKLGYISDKGQVLLKLKPDHGYLVTYLEAGGKKIPAIMEVDKAGNLFETHMLSDGKLSIVNHIKNTVSRVAETAQTVERPWEYFGDPNHHVSKVVEHVQNVTDHRVNVEYGGTGVIDGAMSPDVSDVQYGGAGVIDHTSSTADTVQYGGAGVLHPKEIPTQASIPLENNPVPPTIHSAVEKIKVKGDTRINVNIVGGIGGFFKRIFNPFYTRPRFYPQTIPVYGRRIVSGIGRAARDISFGHAQNTR